MTIEPNPSPPAKPSKPQANDGANAGAVAAAKPSPAFDERALSFAELKECASQLDVNELVEMLGDGRAMVRSNAILGLAAMRESIPQLIPLLRDSDATVACNAAEALSKLGASVRPLVPQIVKSLSGTRREVTEAIIAVLASLIGIADDELIESLDVPLDLAQKSVIAACVTAGARGAALLIKAGTHGRIRIRVNALCGLEDVGKRDLEATRRFLYQVKTTDPVPDARAAAQRAMRALGVRGDGSLRPTA
jgi:predicted RNA-binding Zn ribbon-like protein